MPRHHARPQPRSSCRRREVLHTLQFTTFNGSSWVQESNDSTGLECPPSICTPGFNDLIRETSADVVMLRGIVLMGVFFSEL
eukprot:7663769-Pyramimonas_sp.AAC.1